MYFGDVGLNKIYEDEFLLISFNVATRNLVTRVLVLIPDKAALDQVVGFRRGQQDMGGGGGRH